MLYPILNDARAVIDLGGIWRFRLDDGSGVEQGWQARRLENCDTIAVPASYNDQKEGEAFRDHYGLAFYQTEFSVPSLLTQERLVLRFGAVTHHAQVYLNGNLMISHKGGFLPFEVEIGGMVRDGSNLLTVVVDNRIDHSTLPVGCETPGQLGGMIPADPEITLKKQNYPNFDFFNYAGIVRPVKLYSTPKAFIEDLTVVPSVHGNDAELSYEVRTCGSGEVSLTVTDEDGIEVAQASGASGQITIRNVRLWQPGNAYLYTVCVRFGTDCYTLPVGVRTVELQGNQFLINSRPFYFKGYGKHEDSYFRGRGLDEALNVKDLALMKWQGANSFRTSHYPYSEEMLRLCDREGIVVLDEAPAVGVNLNFGLSNHGNAINTYETIHTHEHHREVLRDLVARDKNHACVVMWIVANEADTASHPDSAVDYFQPLLSLVRECDPQKRPVSLVAIQNDYRKDKAMLLSDVVCLNRYYGWYVYGGDLEAAKQALAKELDYWEQTGKPVMFTEYGADTVSGLHLATPTMFTEEYQVDYYRANNEVADRYPNFIGEQVWNFADFATSQGILRVDGNKKGLFSRDRRPKLAAHYFRQRWHEIPDFDYKH